MSCFGWQTKIVEEFERTGMLVRVNGFQEKDAVFRDVRLGLRAALEKEVLDANSAATEALAKGDLKTYAEVLAHIYRRMSLSFLGSKMRT